MVAQAAPLLDFALYETQWDYVHDPARFTAYVGGIGSGKTYAGAVKALIRMLENPSWSRGMVLAPTYQMLLDATWITCVEAWEPFIAEAVKTPAPRITLITGQVILFRSADDPERLRGPNLWWIWIDEAAYCHPNVWTRALGRVRAGGLAGPIDITTTPNQLNWVYDKVQDGTFSVHYARVEDNPYLSDDYIAALREQYPDQYAAQELDAKFIRFGAGLVKRGWFQRIPVAQHVGGDWTRYWDLAVQTKTKSDMTASVRISLDGKDTYLSRPFMKRMEWPDTEKLVKDVIRFESTDLAIYGRTLAVGIESNAFQLAAVQSLARSREAKMVALFGVHTSNDKFARALTWISSAKQGNVYLIEEPGYDWGPFLDQYEDFPEGKHDDAVDATSGALEAHDQVPKRPKLRARSSQRKGR